MILLLMDITDSLTSDALSVPSASQEAAASAGTSGQSSGRELPEIEKDKSGASSSFGAAASMTSSSEEESEHSSEDEENKEIRKQLQHIFNGIETGKSRIYNNRRLPIDEEGPENEAFGIYDPSLVGSFVGRGEDGIVCKYGNGNQWLVKFWKRHHGEKIYDKEDVELMNYYYGRNAALHVGRQKYKTGTFNTTVMIQIPGVTVYRAAKPKNKHHSRWKSARAMAAQNLIMELANKKIIIDSLDQKNYMFDPEGSAFNPIDLSGCSVYREFDEADKKIFMGKAIDLYGCLNWINEQPTSI